MRRFLLSSIILLVLAACNKEPVETNLNVQNSSATQTATNNVNKLIYADDNEEKVLLDKGTVSQKDKDEALEEVCFYADEERVRLLLAAGAYVGDGALLNTVGSLTNNIGLRDTDSNAAKVLEMLIATGININTTYEKGNTLLMVLMSSDMGDIDKGEEFAEILSTLIRAGVDVNATNDEGQTV